MRPPARFDIKECQAFFALFARFEYAMKAAGIRQTRQSGAVEASWSQLADDVGQELLETTEEKVKEACHYVLQQPPKRQDLKDERLIWSDAPANQGGNAKDLFVYVCRVRNNLFHGGKFQGQYLADPERAELLITAATTILNAVLKMRPQLREAFSG